MKFLSENNRHDYFTALICILVLISSFLFSIEKDESISISGIGVNFHYDFCLFKQLTGIPCPSCGLTRSFIAISHFEFAKALQYNLAGLLIYIIVLLQIPYRFMVIVNSKYAFFIAKPHTLRAVYYYITLVSLFAGWFYRLFYYKII